MDWTIQDYGALGELISAVAVVVTLGYLAIQIRQTNKTQRALTRQYHTDAAQRRIELMLKYSEIRDGTLQQIRGETLTDEQTLTMRSAARYRFRGYENDYFQYMNGLLDESEWQALRREIGLATKSGIFSKEDWDANMPTLTREFAAEVERIVDEYGSTDESWAFVRDID